jgi:hypothetical protein
LEPIDPYAPPPTQIEELKPLGSLAQSARDKHIKQAQVILIIIGLLTMAVNGFLLYNLPNEIAQAVQQNGVDPGQVEEFQRSVTMFGYLIYGGAALLGVVFLVLGLIVKQYPVPITIASLVLYIVSALLFALLNPMSLVQGIVVKVILIVALVRAMKAARAYESDTKKAAAAGVLLE